MFNSIFIAVTFGNTGSDINRRHAKLHKAEVEAPPTNSSSQPDRPLIHSLTSHRIYCAFYKLMNVYMLPISSCGDSLLGCAK